MFQLDAGGPVAARNVRPVAPVNYVLATRPGEPDRTVAEKSDRVHQRQHHRRVGRVVGTGPAVKARSETARPQRRLAVGTDEIVRALTRVRVDSIDTRSTI